MAFDFAFLNLAVIANVDFNYLALNGTGLGDGLGANNLDVGIHHSLIVTSILQSKDVFAVGNCYGILADSNYRGIWQQLNASVPILILNGNSSNTAVWSIYEQRFAHTKLPAFSNTDYWQANNFNTFFHGNSS